MTTNEAVARSPRASEIRRLFFRIVTCSPLIWTMATATPPKEKPPVGGRSLYRYRLHHVNRHSSGQQVRGQTVAQPVRGQPLPETCPLANDPLKSYTKVRFNGTPERHYFP